MLWHSGHHPARALWKFGACPPRLPAVWRTDPRMSSAAAGFVSSARVYRDDRCGPHRCSIGWKVLLLTSSFTNLGTLPFLQHLRRDLRDPASVLHFLPVCLLPSWVKKREQLGMNHLKCIRTCRHLAGGIDPEVWFAFRMLRFWRDGCCAISKAVCDFSNSLP